MLQQWSIIEGCSATEQWYGYLVNLMFFYFFIAVCKDMDVRPCGLILVFQIGALIFLSFHLVDCLFVSVAAMVNHHGLLCH
jgi:hypothetical protein